MNGSSCFHSKTCIIVDDDPLLLNTAVKLHLTSVVAAQEKALQAILALTDAQPRIASLFQEAGAGEIVNPINLRFG